MKFIRVLTFVIVLGTVSSALLVGINAFTMPLIVKNEELKLKSSVLDVLEIPYVKSNIKSARKKIYNQKVSKQLYESKQNNNTKNTTGANTKKDKVKTKSNNTSKNKSK